MKTPLFNLGISLIIKLTLAADSHLTGLTVKDAYGDTASISNCFTTSAYFP